MALSKHNKDANEIIFLKLYMYKYQRYFVVVVEIKLYFKIEMYFKLLDYN